MKIMKTRQTKPGTILSKPDLNPFERLVSEQDTAEATPECKLIDIDEEDKIDIVFYPFPLNCFAAFPFSYCCFDWFPFPCISYFFICCVYVSTHKYWERVYKCVQNAMNAPPKQQICKWAPPPQMTASPLEWAPPLKGWLLHDRPGRSFEEIRYLCAVQSYFEITFILWWTQMVMMQKRISLIKRKLSIISKSHISI